MKYTKENICKEIENDINSFNIRELILTSAPPFEWADGKHPINTLGNYYFGIGDGFNFDKEKVNKADEDLLWKLYGLISLYWKVKNEQSLNRINIVSNMSSITIKESDVGKRMLKVFEEYHDWR